MHNCSVSHGVKFSIIVSHFTLFISLLISLFINLALKDHGYAMVLSQLSSIFYIDHFWLLCMYEHEDVY